MGRRALRSIDPKLDLSGHLCVAGPDVATPLPEWKNASAPLEVEVGSGKGLFLETASGEYPERNFFGIEVAGKYARFAAARLAKQGRTNAAVLHGDAIRFFRESLPAACCHAVHVYFPDPWWKARHRKRRVLNEFFLGEIARVLIPGGKLHFWTDVEEYYHSTLEIIADMPALAGPLPVPAKPAEHDLDYRTHFERRTRLAQLPVYRAEFVRG